MELGEGLLLVALVVVAAVGAHGAWSAWRAGPRRAASPVTVPEVADAAPGAPGLVGAGDARIEPTLDGLPPVELAAAPEPAREAAIPGSNEAVRRLAVAKLRTHLDPLVDAMATVAVEAPVSGEAALAAMPTTRRAGSKPLSVEGLDAETGEWTPVTPGCRYSEFQAGVQLANRAGPLNEIEFSEFVQKVQAFADALGATADFEDMREAVQRARELDAFAHDHDAQLAVHLMSRSIPWTLGYVQQMAARQGLVPGALAGRLVLPSDEDGAPPVLVLGFDPHAALSEDPQRASLRHVTLSLDVPQTAEGLEPFARWQQVATALAAAMDAVLLDDDGREITPAQFAAIEVDLRRLYKALESRDLAAGSASARRLFS